MCRWECATTLTRCAARGVRVAPHERTTRKGRTTPPAPAVRRQRASSTASVARLGAAIRFQQRARRRAQARAPHWIAQQLTIASSSSRVVRTLQGGALREEHVGDLGEVLHVRANTIGFAEHRRLQDVVAAASTRLARRRTPSSQSDRAAPARQSWSSTTTSPRGSASTGSSDRRVTRKPSSATRRVTSAKRSGWRGAHDQAARSADRLGAAKRRERRPHLRRAACSPQSPPAGARRRGRSAGPHSRLCPCGPTPASRCESNFRLQVTADANIRARAEID